MADAPTSLGPAMGRTDEPDSRTSLRHILAEAPAMDASKPSPSVGNTPAPEDSEAGGGEGQGEGEGGRAPQPATITTTTTTTTTRRVANGSVSSVYSGNKIKHLKKDDGMPLWRRDIQYDFLRLVFEDTQAVFTRTSDGTGGHTFADIYLDAMAHSSKCSKILKDKLLSERPAAINMAMVCLLVNVGRMNTTLNFFPEMRAQLRTYHSIPSLQAHQDPSAYKQLQDAPRLKSILKGATDDDAQPSTVDEIRQAAVPRTNPVNLIFVLSQYAPKVSELHFFPPRDFFDLVMRPTLSSRSRATAFLWLMWWYLESDFSPAAAAANPFGPGRLGPPDDPATASVPLKCPPFVVLTPAQEAQENVDTPDERAFGEMKRQERAAILASDLAPAAQAPKRPAKKPFPQNPVFSVLADEDDEDDDAAAAASTPGRDRPSPSHASARARGKIAKTLVYRDDPSDTDRTRSASPPVSVSATRHLPAATPTMRINTLLNNSNNGSIINDTTGGPASSPAPPKGPGRGNWSRHRAAGMHLSSSAARAFKSRLDGTASQDGASPSTNAPTFNGPHGFYLPLNGSDPSHKRTRPLTQHQLAVEQYRRRRVDVILSRSLRLEYATAARRRRRANPFMLSWIRCKGMPDGYDTDEETHSQSKYVSGGGGDALDTGSGTKTPPPMPAGLVPLDFGGEINDHGEESHYRAKMLGRALRRMERWEGRRATGSGGGSGSSSNTQAQHQDAFKPAEDRRPMMRNEEDEESDEDYMVHDEDYLVRDIEDTIERGSGESDDESDDDEPMTRIARDAETEADTKTDGHTDPQGLPSWDATPSLPPLSRTR